MIKSLLSPVFYQSNIDFHAILQRELSRPGIVAVSEPVRPLYPLEKMIEQGTPGREYTLDQVKAELSRPYHDPNKISLVLVQDELVTRGKVVKFALSNFSSEQLKELGGVFENYHWNVIAFQLGMINLNLRYANKLLEKKTNEMEKLVVVLKHLEPKYDELMSFAFELHELARSRGM